MGGIINTLNRKLVKERNENERLRAELYKQDATIAYVAVMADVDLPDDEAEEGENDE